MPLLFLILGTLFYSYLDLDVAFSVGSREIETVRTPLRGGLEHFGNCEASKRILDIIHVGCTRLGWHITVCIHYYLQSPGI
jgi:hypothetical protein